MIKFLTALLTLLNRIWSAWETNRQQEQGRQDAAKEAADEIQRQIDLAEHAVDAADPDRVRRMRARFDAAASD